MKKEKAAPQNGTTPNTYSHVNTTPIRGATKRELVALFRYLAVFLTSSDYQPHGITKNDGHNAQGKALPKIRLVDLPSNVQQGTILSVGATNPNGTTSESGHPQPTISGFFVPAIWATTPGQRTNEHHTHAEHGGSASAFAVWSRGPNKPARVNKARLLSEVVDAMPHPICSMADSLNRERVKAMIYTFLIQRSRACRLVDLCRPRTISTFAHTEAEARVHLAGLPLVFVSRTPTGRAKA